MRKAKTLSFANASPRGRSIGTAWNRRMADLGAEKATEATTRKTAANEGDKNG